VTVHTTAQNSSDTLPSYLQTNIIAQILSIREGGILVLKDVENTTVDNDMQQKKTVAVCHSVWVYHTSSIASVCTVPKTHKNSGSVTVCGFITPAASRQCVLYRKHTKTAAVCHSVWVYHTSSIASLCTVPQTHKNSGSVSQYVGLSH